WDRERAQQGKVVLMPSREHRAACKGPIRCWERLGGLLKYWLWAAFGEACLTPRGGYHGSPSPLQFLPKLPGAQRPACTRLLGAWWNPVFGSRLESWYPHAARRKRCWSKSRLARPNIWRLSSFKRLIWPSTGPLLQGRVTPALTAS